MEKIVAARILQKYLTRQNTSNPLSIFSVIAQDHLKGYIYIEARRENHVREVCYTSLINLLMLFYYNCVFMRIGNRQDGRYYAIQSDNGSIR